MAAPKNDNVKQQILDAAIALFQEQHDVSLAEIAKAAHVSKGTLFYHYRSKAEIYLDIGERYWSKLSNDLLIWVDNKDKDTSIPRLVRYTFIRGVFDESGLLRLRLFVEAVSGEEGSEIKKRLNEQYAHFKNILKERICERMPGSDGEQLAWLLLTLVDGLMVQNTMQNESMDLNAFIEFMAKRFPELG
ncbi:MAG: TetR/AcrR family transcriptional regulator [Clostridiaceae bacterium]